MKERRNKLFSKGLRGQYPQVFLVSGGEGGDARGGKGGDDNETITFIGLYEAVQDLNEMNDLPVEVLKANPQLQTFDQVFKSVIC